MMLNDHRGNQLVNGLAGANRSETEHTDTHLEGEENRLTEEIDTRCRCVWTSNHLTVMIKLR